MPPTPVSKRLPVLFLVLFLGLIGASPGAEQAPARGVQLGSQTAKNGFRNEDEIRDKFNAWKTDADAQGWLAAMKYKLSDQRHCRYETARRKSGC
jgi:hypothetical protein